MNDNKPVSVREVADHFDVSVDTVNRWVREMRIPCVRPSLRTVRFHLKEVEEALSMPATFRRSENENGQ